MNAMEIEEFFTECEYEQEFETETDAKENAKSKLVDFILPKLVYRYGKNRKDQKIGIQALEDLDEALDYMPKEKIYLAQQQLPNLIESDGWLFETQGLLSEKFLEKKMNSYCPNGWFSVYTNSDSNNLSCTISVKKSY